MKVLILLSLFACSFASPDEIYGLEDPRLFEGDLILSPQQRRAVMRGGYINEHHTRGSSAEKEHLWPGGVMYYDIDTELENQPYAMRQIKGAMEMWESTTCIRFVRRTNEFDYVYFYESDRCSSMLGRNGGEQEIEVAPKCYLKGMIAHEIAHALGFYHEQARPDRDDYVTIHLNKVHPMLRYNFKKFDKSYIDSLGTPYDYASIMHYGMFAFGGGSITIEPKEKGVIIGRRTRLSEMDIKQMNLLYKCPAGNVQNIATTPRPPTRPPTTKPPPVKCEDDNKYCKYYANRGECEKKPGYMKLACPKACNFC